MITLRHGSYVRALPCERVSGDMVVAQPVAGGTLFAIIDGLGHGESAHRAASVIARNILAYGSFDPLQTLHRAHRAARRTGGAAVGLLFIDADNAQLCYCGIGNTVLRILAERDRRLPSGHGIVGQHMRTPPLHRLSVHPGNTLLMYTDGVKTSFSMTSLQRFREQSSEQLARIIVQRFGKPTDDAACMAITIDHGSDQPSR